MTKLGLSEPKFTDGEWHEILFAFSKLKQSGKMVVLVTNSALANNPTVKIRQFLVENGNIRSIIELPDKLLENVGIELLCSRTITRQQGVKFLDASQAYTEQRRRKDIDVTTSTRENLDKS